MAYTATLTSSGTYQIKKDGTPIATVAASALPNYGLSTTKLTSGTATTAIGNSSYIPTYTPPASTPAPTPTPTYTPPVSAPKAGPGQTIVYGPNGQTQIVATDMMGQAIQSLNQQTGGEWTPTPPKSAATGAPSTDMTASLNALLANPNLTSDQKKMLSEYFDVVSKGDADRAKRMIAAFNAGSSYSEPLFRAQVMLVTDALTRGLSGITGDLATQGDQARSQRDKILQDLSASNQNLSLNNQQELSNLADVLGQDVETNAQNMAAAGFTSSSNRLKKEAILNKNYQGLVESKNRQLGYTTAQNQRNADYSTGQIASQLQQLQDKATQDRIKLLRGTEQLLGTSGLQGLGYSGADVLGTAATPINSTLQRDQLKDAFSFAGNFV